MASSFSSKGEDGGLLDHSASSSLLSLLEGGGEEERVGVKEEEEEQDEVEGEHEQEPDDGGGWSSSSFLHSRSLTTTPRSRQSSPRSSALPFSSSPSPFRSSSGISRFGSSSAAAAGGWRRRLLSGFWIPWGLLLGVAANANLQQKQQRWGPESKKVGLRGWLWQAQRRRRRTRSILAVVAAATAALFLLMNWWMFSLIQEVSFRKGSVELSFNGTSPSASSLPLLFGRLSQLGKGRRHHRVMYGRLLALAAHALAEGDNKPEPPELWQEPSTPDSLWTPCADQRNWGTCEGNNGYILVTANGGINQQRVAICNAVSIARLLNSTLVVPNFLYSSVWKDGSRFGEIYQEDHFIDYLKADIHIVKELPVELQSLDLEAIGSVVTDTEVMKESKPSFFLKKILPILLKNRVVHFIGFGNRLAFDPVPFELQRLRCRCNFHALRFVSKIQEAGALLVQRMRKHVSRWGPLDHNLVGPYAAELNMKEIKNNHIKDIKYLAVHLRFEIDMAAHSLCYFGGGKEEEEELEAYRATHFPALTLLMKTTKIPSAIALRSEGQCPLTPEEAVLMLAALGFKRRTNIYVAGAHIYGGKSRMAVLTSLYPNLATKENLLSSSEIGPFLNYTSQLAALDYIVCAAADAFAMTDSGSQFSSLVSGYRMYYGGGRLPTIRPNKRRLSDIFSKNSTIEWRVFEERVRKAVRQTKKPHERPIARSVYRHPRCLECMCKTM